MKEELKIRLRNVGDFEKNLIKLDGKFLREINAIDTYFKQPKGEVLKITEDDRGDYLVSLKSENGKFKIIKYKPLTEAKKTKKELSMKFGIKCILKKKRRFFELGKYKININLINNLGDFLIIEGKDLNKKIITDKLKIKNPEFITVSFDELFSKKINKKDK
ncbi:hypothetical protein GF386_01035 [Candidatus Pacearchaeota archaeon]|nr:hypothetical protein [Candidatus Pacearchaeota archaeon]MBD3282818.1 hypothetical protein [Candidatus Pacearchaeota archaeon]